MSRSLSISTVCCAFASLFLLASVANAEKIANPAYDQWAKFKPGAFAKHEGETVAMGNANKMTMMAKLVELTDEKAVVESTTSMSGMDMPPQKMELTKMMEKVEMPKVEGQEMPKPDTREGEERLDIAGKSLKCKTIETMMKMGDINVTSKVWMSDEVPGGMVKMESKTDGAMASTTTQKLTEFSAGG